MHYKYSVKHNASFRDVKVQILIWFQTFSLFTKPHFQTFNALKSTSFQAFQVISDFFSQMLSHPWPLKMPVRFCKLRGEIGKENKPLSYSSFILHSWCISDWCRDSKKTKRSALRARTGGFRGRREFGWLISRRCTYFVKCKHIFSVYVCTRVGWKVHRPTMMQLQNLTKCGLLLKHSLPCGAHTSSIVVAALGFPVV